MKSLTFLIVLCSICMESCIAKDLIVGTSYNMRLTWQQDAHYMAIPFKKRVKQVFYTDPAQQVIKGIIARDADNSEGYAIVTAGGVGFPYVNIRLKSARGSGLKYHIEIYV